MACSISKNLSLYSYTRQNPVRMVDPDGRIPLDTIADVGFIIYDLGALAWDETFNAGENSEENLAALAADGAGLLIPYGTGGGIIVRNADEAVDVGRTIARACSFHGDTLVQTAEGMVAIAQITVGDLVWSRNPATGQMGWKRVLAAYSNTYEETVWVSIRDTQTGEEQVILSNRIHPFFVQRLAGGMSTSPAGMVLQELSSEGHVYRGPIPGGAWVDAAYLRAGDRLLNADGSWAEVVGIEVKADALEAFNLTVDGFSTYFVAGNLDAEAVWVHNVCGSARFGETSFRSLNRNRSLGDLTDADLQRLFQNSPFD